GHPSTGPHPSLLHPAHALNAEHQGAGAPGREANLARVRAYASARNVTIEVKRFARTTRPAEDAAREIGTDVARIVKSLVFVAERGEATPVVALCSGQGRVDETRLAAALGVPTVRRATADEAKTFTGYAIGGVPPFAHA